MHASALPDAGCLAVVLNGDDGLAVYDSVVGGDVGLRPFTRGRVLDGSSEEGVSRYLVALVEHLVGSHLAGIDGLCQFLVDHDFVFTALGAHVARGGLVRLRDVGRRVVVGVEQYDAVVVVVGRILQVVVHDVALVDEVRIGVGSHVADERLSEGGGSELRQLAVALGHCLGFAISYPM